MARAATFALSTGMSLFLGLFTGLSLGITLPRIAAAQDYLCRTGPYCTAGECQTPPRDTMGLRIDDAGARIITPDEPEDSLRLVPFAPEGLDGMRAFVSADARDLAVLTLRDDGALTIAVMAGRGLSSNNLSVLATAQCEVRE